MHKNNAIVSKQNILHFARSKMQGSKKLWLDGLIINPLNYYRQKMLRSSKSILHIVGNRPQFVKLAVLHKELRLAGSFDQEIIHTGQHFSPEMSNFFFDDLNIPAADINLDINNLPHNQFIAKTTDVLEQCFAKKQDSIAFVYGDTNTTMAAAIAAKRTGIFLAHFEAGVRTGDLKMPEELNRVVTDRLADINFCCTQRNHAAMTAEGFGHDMRQRAFLTGDLMLDAFNTFTGPARSVTTEKTYVACTIHRAANISSAQSLHQVIDALNYINTQLPVICPVHPNTRKMLAKFECKADFTLLHPLGYHDMRSLLASAEYIITDSGGACREAYFLQKPLLVIMDAPFWPEIVEAGCAVSCSAVKESIIKNFYTLAGLKGNYRTNIFGNGTAAKQIREILTTL